MFDLEASIAQWRRELQAAGLLQFATLYELETHLRDEIDRQLQMGSDIQRAFDLAVAEIGDPNALNHEFAKLDQSCEAKKRKILAIFSFLPVTLVFGLLQVFTWKLTFEMRVQTFLVTFLLALYVCSLPAFYWFLPWNPNRRLRTFIQIGSTCSWLFFGVIIMDYALPLLHARIELWAIVLWAMMSIQPIVCWIAYSLSSRNGPAPGSGSNPSHAFAPLPRSPLSPEFRCSKKLSSQVQQALANAKEEAVQFHHDFIGTEHVLLGLLALEREAVANWLQQAGVEPDAVRTEIEKLIGIGPLASTTEHLLFTPRASKALKLAAREARIAKHPVVDTRHLLLGLLREGEGAAALILKKLGLRLEVARLQLTKH